MSEIDEIIKETMDHISEQINKLEANRDKRNECHEKLNAKIFEIEIESGFIHAHDGSWLSIDKIDVFFIDKSQVKGYPICALVGNKPFELYHRFGSYIEAQTCLDTLVKNLYGDQE